MGGDRTVAGFQQANSTQRLCRLLPDLQGRLMHPEWRPLRGVGSFFSLTLKCQCRRPGQRTRAPTPAPHRARRQQRSAAPPRRHPGGRTTPWSRSGASVSAIQGERGVDDNYCTKIPENRDQSERPTKILRELRSYAAAVGSCQLVGARRPAAAAATTTASSW